jgi:hypothetical protein
MVLVPLCQPFRTQTRTEQYKPNPNPMTLPFFPEVRHSDVIAVLRQPAAMLLMNANPF